MLPGHLKSVSGSLLSFHCHSFCLAAQRFTCAISPDNVALSRKEILVARFSWRYPSGMFKLLLERSIHILMGKQPVMECWGSTGWSQELLPWDVCGCASEQRARKKHVAEMVWWHQQKLWNAVGVKVKPLACLDCWPPLYNVSMSHYMRIYLNTCFANALEII